MRFGAARVTVVGLCWLGVSAAVLIEPLLLLLWPLSGPAFLLPVIGSAVALGPAVSFREPLLIARRQARALKVLLALLACCAIAGAITAVVPSIAYRPEGGDATLEFGLSVRVAPVLWAAMLGMSIGALATPSPRRLALVAVTGVVSWPVFLWIRVLREPILDLDNTHHVLAPWALQLYVVAAVIASGLAIAVAIATTKMISGLVVQMPPKASVLRG